MAVVTGTATSYSNLLAAFVTFVTTNTALTSAVPAQNWTLQSSNTTPYTDINGDQVVSEYILKAPGLSGSESIYIQLQAFNGNNAGTLYYNVRMRGATGYNSTQSWSAQPGASPDTFIHLSNGSIPYTFIANGQRALIVAQVGTVFESAYLGKILPYGAPTQYPYPVYIGGTSISRQLPTSDTSTSHSAFFDPAGAYLYLPGGGWQLISSTAASARFFTWPYTFGSSATAPTLIETNLDGSYPLFQVRVESVPSVFPPTATTTPTPNEFGELDGVYFVPGVGQTSGSTITVSTTTYLVTQNTFKTAANSFAAFIEA